MPKKTNSERITALEVQIIDFDKRIDNQAQILENVQDMAISMKGMMVEMQHLRENMNNMQSDVDAMKARPAKRWEALVEQILALCCAASIGGLLVSIIGRGG